MKLRDFSAFSRAEAHLIQQTQAGGVLTLLGLLLAVILFGHETAHFWRLHSVTKMSVDTEHRHELPINLDITFPAMPCAALSIQVIDIGGTSESDTSASAGAAKEMDIHKQRLNSKGQPTGEKEYVTPKSESTISMGGLALMNINLMQAVKHFSDVEREAGQGEGCHFSGTIIVNRVAGKVLLGTHQLLAFHLFPQLLAGRKIPVLRNMSHNIKHLSFGPAFPGLVNPLDNFDRILTEDLEAFKYYLKVVPTEHKSRRGQVTETHQYSVSEYAIPLPTGDAYHAIPTQGDTVPSVELNYDLSPIVVEIDAVPPSFLHYLVRISAVIGGAWSLVRMINQHAHALFNLTPSTASSWIDKAMSHV